MDWSVRKTLDYSLGPPAFGSRTFQKPEVEGYEYQDNSYIHGQPLPKMVLEEQEIYSDHSRYQQQHIKHGSHSVPSSNIGRADKESCRRSNLNEASWPYHRQYGNNRDDLLRLISILRHVIS